MTPQQRWIDLADAFRAAIGPDCKLDARLMLLAKPELGTTLYVQPRVGYWKRIDGAKELPVLAPRFSDTLHIGETIKLLGDVLPEANCHGYDFGPREVAAYVSRNNVREGHWLQEAVRNDNQIALALCEAICRAMDEGSEP